MTVHRSTTLPFQALPFWAALLPLLTIHVCYLVAAGLDHLPLCVPHVTGCTSTSATGRLLPESLLFRAGMIPAAVIILLFWDRCATFLQHGDQSTSRAHAIRLCGAAAALSLILYTVNLGIVGDSHRLMRRIGIDGFFVGNYIAQLLLLFFYGPMSRPTTRFIRRCLVVVCVLLPAALVVGEGLKWSGVAKDPVNNVVEWNGLALVCGYYALVAWLWRGHGFVAVFRFGTGRS